MQLGKGVSNHPTLRIEKARGGWDDKALGVVRGRAGGALEVCVSMDQEALQGGSVAVNRMCPRHHTENVDGT